VKFEKALGDALSLGLFFDLIYKKGPGVLSFVSQVKWIVKVGLKL